LSASEPTLFKLGFLYQNCRQDLVHQAQHCVEDGLAAVRLSRQSPSTGREVAETLLCSTKTGYPCAVISSC